MRNASPSLGALAAALALAQSELLNPEKTLTAALSSHRPGGAARRFRYAPLSSGLEMARRALSRQSIAVIQTTAIDREAGILSLHSALLHNSGEWVGSDWPVCGLSDLVEPHRVGAAMTYARRYSLFALIGIAGEDDLDAPDLDIAPEPATAVKTATGSRHGSRSSKETLAVSEETLARSPGSDPMSLETRASSREPRVASADPENLRACLIAEVERLKGGAEAWRWAQARLDDKNALPRRYAEDVEREFAAQLSRLEAGLEDVPADVLSLPAPKGNPEENTEAQGSARLVGLDAPNDLPGADGGGAIASGPPEIATLSPVALGRAVAAKTLRLRDKAHLKFVASRPCLVCGRKPADPHHLGFAQPRAMARKASDEFVVPLCRVHHDEAHKHGDEARWWSDMRMDPIAIALALWRRSRDGASG